MIGGGWVSKTWLLFVKELRVEWRAREVLPPMLVFSAAVMLLLALSAPGSAAIRLTRPPPPGTIAMTDVVPAFMWVTVLFAGLIGFARGIEAERAGGALEAVSLAPVDRSAIYIAKAGANLLFIVAVEIVLLPLVALVSGFDIGSGWISLIVVALLLDVGFAAAGTLMAAVASTTRSRELMLPILALPLLLPAFLAALEMTSDILLGQGLGSFAGRGWLALLVAYDVVVVAAGVMSFEFALEP